MNLEVLAQSNAPPTQDEAAFLLERISSLDGTITQLDVELAHARKTLEELNYRHTTLRDRRHSYATIVSLFRQLPVDIWIEIMKFAVWSTTTPSLENESAAGPASGVDLPARNGSLSAAGSSVSLARSDDDGKGHWLEAKQLATFTRVCKDWKRLLYESPVFWCSLALHIYTNDDGLDEFSPKLEAWLNRSGNLPWSLKLLSSKRQLHAPLFASFLQRNCGRWKELRLYMQDLDVLAPLFHLEPASSASSRSNRYIGEDTNEQDWRQLETLSLDGWFTESAKVHPFSVDSDRDPDPSAALHPPSICMAGAMPALTSLILDMPCQKVHTWKWVPWAQLTDLDLKTGDTYEDNVSILSKCSSALQTCSFVFTPSLRFPAGMPAGPLPQVVASVLVEADSDEGPSDNDYDDRIELLRFPKLKELTLKNIGYLSPLLSRLTLPALQKLFIAMSPINEPEPYLVSCLIDFLDRSGSSDSSSTEGDAQGKPLTSAICGPPLTYLLLALENTRHRRIAVPVISNAEYLRIFERTEKLKTLHLKDYSTDARFLEKVHQRGLLSKLRTISFVVEGSERVSGRFDSFVRARSSSSVGRF